MSRDFISGLRCLVVWSTATVATGLLLSLSAPALSALARAANDFDGLLVGVAAGLASVAACWLWIVVSITVVGAARGRVLVVRGCPGALRRLVLTGCGVVLAAGLAAPAHADAPRHQDRLGVAPVLASLASLPLPDRAVTTPRRAVTTTYDVTRGLAPADPEPQTSGSVTVRPGDTLWSLARGALPADTTGDEIARYSRSLHRLNADVIGADPDLILPGQRLRLPRR